MNTVKTFLRILDLHTLIVTLLSLCSTYFCRIFNLEAEIPGGLIGIAIVFPIVFSISSAYRRRDEVLRYYASLKAHAVALYYAHRDWAPRISDNESDEHVNLIRALLEAVKKYFTAPKHEQLVLFRKVYEIFSEFSRSHESLRRAGVTSGEISRANQYLRSIIIEFERMRNILLYRTPFGLRAYSRVFLNIFPVLFGPYFAYLSQKSYAVVGYGVAVMYSVVLVSLDNIQEHLENPYDKIGGDDVNLEIASELDDILLK